MKNKLVQPINTVIRTYRPACGGRGSKGLYMFVRIWFKPAVLKLSEPAELDFFRKLLLQIVTVGSCSKEFKVYKKICQQYF